MIDTSTYGFIISKAKINFDSAILQTEPNRHQRCVECTKMLVILFTVENLKPKYVTSKVINRDFKELDRFYSENYQHEFSSVYTHEDEEHLENIQTSIVQAEKFGYGFTFDRLDVSQP